MRAPKSLQQSLNKHLDFLHAKRRVALFRCVFGLLVGGRLWLTALGRALPGATSDKHRIKAVDRFLGNKGIQKSLPAIYAAIAQWFIRDAEQVVVAVDWTRVGAHHYALSAGLCHRSRTIQIYSQVHPEHLQNNPGVERAFLDELAEVLPARCKPIIVTDAGFQTSWFDAVREHGWDFVGRCRNRTKFLRNGEWVAPETIRNLAGRRPRSLGRLVVRKSDPRTFRVVLAPKPKLKGRKRRTKRGNLKRGHDQEMHSRGARQPWVLITSLSSSAEAIVSTYALRMQIEQTFRDLKNRRHGLALSDVRSRCPKRIEVLLMCAAIAHLALQSIGIAAERSRLHDHFQANSVRDRRILSTFALARCLFARTGLVDPRLATCGLLLLHDEIQRVADSL